MNDESEPLPNEHDARQFLRFGFQGIMNDVVEIYSAIQANSQEIAEAHRQLTEVVKAARAGKAMLNPAFDRSRPAREYALFNAAMAENLSATAIQKMDADNASVARLLWMSRVAECRVKNSVGALFGLSLSFLKNGTFENIVKSRSAVSAVRKKLANDSKQAAKRQVKECWDRWQTKPGSYSGPTHFARDMLEKFPELISVPVIVRWCGAWRTEASRYSAH